MNWPRRPTAAPLAGGQHRLAPPARQQVNDLAEVLELTRRNSPVYQHIGHLLQRGIPATEDGDGRWRVASAHEQPILVFKRQLERVGESLDHAATGRLALAALKPADVAGVDADCPRKL